MDSDTGGHHPIVQKILHFISETYSMDVGRTRNIRKGWNYFMKCASLVKSYCFCTQKAQLEEQPKSA